ncbi:MAG: DUF1624 domain-containing protein [Oscillospiraceae bacterium]|nr:DUF1624 domain-containing protein [Oscillospiraceae bacterium]
MPAVLVEQKNKTEGESFGRNNRIDSLDLLRGAAITYVMVYHLLYDLVNYEGVRIGFFGTDIFEFVHMFFIDVLIVVSGICSGFSHNVIKRGAELFLMGSILTIATDLFVQDTVFVFGALSFFGVMMMICGVCRPVLDKIDSRVLLAVSMLLYFITVDFDDGGTLHLLFTDVKLPLPEGTMYSYPIGIKPKGFFSADYFPLIPNGFLYLSGEALSGSVAKRKLPKFFYSKIKVPAVNFIGRHSLLFYILHQPVLLMIMFVI